MSGVRINALEKQVEELSKRVFALEEENKQLREAIDIETSARIRPQTAKKAEGLHDRSHGGYFGTTT